jgi:hypothetical protein
MGRVSCRNINRWPRLTCFFFKDLSGDLDFPKAKGGNRRCLLIVSRY